MRASETENCALLLQNLKKSKKNYGNLLKSMVSCIHEYVLREQKQSGLQINHMKGRYTMGEKLEEIKSAILANELIRKIRRQEEEKKGHPIVVILVIIGCVATVAAIAYAVYRYMNPKYADFDADFDYDEFEDDFDDLKDDKSDDDDAFASSGSSDK